MADIGVKLTGDNSEFKGMLTESAGKAEEFAGRVANKVGDKLFGLRDVSHAIATALGINIENIAKHAALFIIGSSEEMQKAWEDIAKQTDEIAKLTEERARARLNANQLLVKDTHELNRLQRESAALELSRKVFAEETRMGWAKTAAEKARDLDNEQKLNANIIAQLLLGKQIEEDKAKILAQKNKILDEGIKISQENEKLNYEALSTADKIKRLVSERAQFEADIRRGGLDRVATEASENEVLRRTLEIEKLRKEYSVAGLEAEKENIKLKFESLSPTEKIARLEKERKMFLDDLRRGALDRVAIETNENEILKRTLEIEKLRAEAVKSTTNEYEKQWQAILKLGGQTSTPGGGLSAPDPRMVAAEKELKAAEIAARDLVTNPNGIRRLYAAQLQIDQLQSGISPTTYKVGAMVDAAFGPEKSAGSAALKESSDAARAGAAATSSLHSTVVKIGQVLGINDAPIRFGSYGVTSDGGTPDTSKGSGLSMRPASFSGK